MMGIKAPDFRIETVLEFESYLRLWIDHHVGVRVDPIVAKGVMWKILNEEIPHKREVNKNAAVAPNYSIGLVAVYYMLASALGAKYGVNFGHWSDDGKNFHSWKVQDQNTLRALNYAAEIMFTKATAKKLGQKMMRRLPVVSSEIDKKWKKAIARDSRKNEQMMEAMAHELAKVGGLSIDESEEALYQIELGERLQKRKFYGLEQGKKGFEGVTFLRRVDAAHLPFSRLSAPNEVPEVLKDKIESAVKRWVKAVEELDE